MHVRQLITSRIYLIQSNVRLAYRDPWIPLDRREWKYVLIHDLCSVDVGGKGAR